MAPLPVLSSSSGSELEALEGHGCAHRLEGRVVEDGALLELLTEGGWVSGHYRGRIHPETGEVAFDIHISRAKGSDAHIRFHLPHGSLLRWPVRPERSVPSGLARRD